MEFQSVDIIRSSGLFDVNWYLSQLQDGQVLPADPIEHYLLVGSKQGLMPNRLFNPGWYNMQYPDVAATGIDPLLHYIANGWREGRRPSAAFDPSYYSKEALYYNENEDPFAHYLANGQTSEVSIDEYQDWIARYDTLTEKDYINISRSCSEMHNPPVISVIMPVYNTPEIYLRQTIQSVLSQIYPFWELCIVDDCSTMSHVRIVLNEYAAMDPRIHVVFHETNGHISTSSNTALDIATGDYVALLDHDDMLRPHSLFMFADAITRRPNLMIIYSDEDRIDGNGYRFLPHFKSDWNKSLFLGQNFTCHLTVYKKVLLQSTGGFRTKFNGSQDYDLMLRAQALAPEDAILHIPHILYHWRAIPGSTASNSQEAKPYSRNAAIDAVSAYLVDSGQIAEVISSPHPAFNRVIFSVNLPLPSVLLIINIGDSTAEIVNTLESLIKKTDYSNYNIVIVVKNYHRNPHDELTALMARFSDRITVCTSIMEVARDERLTKTGAHYICHIAQPFVTENEDWLKELVSLAQQSGTAIVGGAIYDGRNAVVEGAYALHPDELARPLFGELSIGDGLDYGYFGRATLVQEVSAVSFACVLIDAEVLARLRGWSRLATADRASAVDLCLEVRDQGLSVVWTPYTRLRSTASARYPEVSTLNGLGERIREKWDVRLRHDPFVGPNLDVGLTGLTLAFPPRLKVFEKYEDCFAEAVDTAQVEQQVLTFNMDMAKTAILASGLFHFEWYTSQNPDVAESGMDPLNHYLTYGWREGRRPNPKFDPAWYLSNNADVMNSGIEPFSHYVLHGRNEGRVGFPLTSITDDYAAEAMTVNAEGNYHFDKTMDIRSNTVNFLNDHIVYEKLTDQDWGALASEPLGKAEAVLHSSDNSLDPVGIISGSGLFNPNYYLSENPDVYNAGIDPLLHYASHGWREGRSPNEAFDSAWYLDEYEDVRASGMEPLTHYIIIGSSEGRRPNRSFDPIAYRAEHHHLAASGLEPLTHFLLTSSSAKGGANAVPGNNITRFSDYPPLELPDLFELKGLVPGGRIAVVLHLYHPDLWDEIAKSIEYIIFPFDLFVTLVKGHSDHRNYDILERFPAAHVIIFEQNRGRDVAPFFALLETGVLFRYDLICKLHSKRSTYVPDGDAWRRELIDGILGSPENVRKIVQAFDNDPDLGIVVADHNIYRGVECWTGNERFLDVLLPRLGISTDYLDKSFPGGAIFWMRPIILRAIMGAGISLSDFEPEPMPVNGALGHSIERLYGLVCENAGMTCLETSQIPVETGVDVFSEGISNKIHTFAFLLPQFHPIEENNRWWGEGFTEWTNVTKASKIFPEHRQPRLPTELGFYDLRLSDTRMAQAELAKLYGIDGFCYYYYWFNGRRILERPLNEVLRLGKPDLPFLICWANEPWTRNWDGLNANVLLPQTYENGWESDFVEDVAPILSDGRYFKFNGKPMVMIYRVRHIPNLEASVRRLREAFASKGFPEIHLVAGLVDFPNDEDLAADPRELGFDAYYEFPPHRVPAILMKPRPKDIDPECRNLFDYGKTVNAALDKLKEPVRGTRHRGVMAGFDNTARRGVNATVFYGANPANFRRWLRQVVNKERQEDGERVIFVNAWNEWAEGTYLEPDRDFGRGWLEAVRSAVGLSPRIG